MTTSDPQDLSARLHTEAAPPAQSPAFFDTLAFSAAQSTPTVGAALFMGVGRSKVIAVTAGTALLLSGAAYAGGLMGGGGPDKHSSSTVVPAHHSSGASTDESANPGKTASGPARHHVDAKAHHHAKHGMSGQGSDPSTGPTPTDPSTDPANNCPHSNPSTGSSWYHWHNWGHGGDGDGWGGDGWGHGGDGDGDGPGGSGWGGWGGTSGYGGGR